MNGPTDGSLQTVSSSAIAVIGASLPQRQQCCLLLTLVVSVYHPSGFHRSARGLNRVGHSHIRIPPVTTLLLFSQRSKEPE